MNGRLTLSDPLVKELAKASCLNHTYYDNLPILGDGNWQQWSDALQHAALMAGTDAVRNGESRHPISLEGKQSTLAEWNENIKRSAVWRCRNECLLKAMRHSLNPDLDLSEFEGLDARRTYLGLKSTHRITDNQQAFKLYSDKLTGELIELADSPRETANRLKEAFDQYNNLVGRNLEQRLPQNYLKMVFLDALDSDAYGDLSKTLLKDHNILALDQGSALTFDELVDLVIAERARLLPRQTNYTTSAPAASTQRPLKRNISQVDEPAQLDPHEPCSLPHHNTSKHTNQMCETQNPRLRPKNWTASIQDQKYLAQHPEVEDPFSDDNSSDDNSSGDNSSGDNSSGDNSSDDDSSGDSSSDDSSLDDSSSDDSKDDDKDAGVEGIAHLNQVSKVNKKWKDTAVARHAEVKAQKDAVTAGCKVTVKKRSSYPTVRGDLTGEWLLYSKNYNPGFHHHIHLWETSSNKQKRKQPNNQSYEGKLIIGPREKAEIFMISSFRPFHHVTGRHQQINFTQSGRKTRGGGMTFWGDGKMIATVPTPVIGDSSGKTLVREFAGLQRSESDSSDGGSSDEESNSGDNSDNAQTAPAGERYDRVIRTARHASVAIKVEEDENTAWVRDTAKANTPVAIKAEESDSSDPDSD